MQILRKFHGKIGEKLRKILPRFRSFLACGQSGFPKFWGEFRFKFCVGAVFRAYRSEKGMNHSVFVNSPKFQKKNTSEKVLERKKFPEKLKKISEKPTKNLAVSSKNCRKPRRIPRPIGLIGLRLKNKLFAVLVSVLCKSLNRGLIFSLQVWKGYEPQRFCQLPEVSKKRHERKSFENRIVFKSAPKKNYRFWKLPTKSEPSTSEKRTDGERLAVPYLTDGGRRTSPDWERSENRTEKKGAGAYGLSMPFVSLPLLVISEYSLCRCPLLVKSEYSLCRCPCWFCTEYSRSCVCPWKALSETKLAIKATLHRVAL